MIPVLIPRSVLVSGPGGVLFAAPPVLVGFAGLRVGGGCWLSCFPLSLFSSLLWVAAAAWFLSSFSSSSVCVGVAGCGGRLVCPSVRLSVCHFGRPVLPPLGHEWGACLSLRGTDGPRLVAGLGGRSVLMCVACLSWGVVWVWVWGRCWVWCIGGGGCWFWAVIGRLGSGFRTAVSPSYVPTCIPARPFTFALRCTDVTRAHFHHAHARSTLSFSHCLTSLPGPLFFPLCPCFGWLLGWVCSVFLFCHLPFCRVFFFFFFALWRTLDPTRWCGGTFLGGGL